MTISGVTGATFFYVANFSNLLRDFSLIAGLLQLMVNAFVFYSWREGYKEETSWNFAKFVAFWGVVIPIVMASVTVWRVFIPMLTGVF